MWATFIIKSSREVWSYFTSSLGGRSYVRLAAADAGAALAIIALRCSYGEILVAAPILY